MRKARNFIESNIGQLILLFGVLLCILIGAFRAKAQTPSEVYRFCVEIGVKHPEIVTSQSIQETMWYKCEKCSMRFNNILGLRYSPLADEENPFGYLKFNHWKRSIYYYRDWQIRKGYDQYKDYFDFLYSIGYAEDSDYIANVKLILKQIGLD